LWFVSVSVSGGTVVVSQVSWNYFILRYITRRVWRYDRGNHNLLIEGQIPNGQNKKDKQEYAIELCFLLRWVFPLVYSNSSAHNIFKQKTNHTKKNVANTGVPQHEHFRWLLLWFKTVIKSLVFIFSVKLQTLLRLYVDVFSLIIVSKFGRSNRPFKVVNFCRPNMMKFKHFPALNLTILLMEYFEYQDVSISVR
jgi:hypothetical protein